MCILHLPVLQALEYSIHRWAFHAEPRSWWGITLHFALHGCHHKFPMDALRLVFPPAPALLLAGGIYGSLRLLFPQVPFSHACLVICIL